MSEKVLEVTIMPLELEKKTETPTNGSITKPQVEPVGPLNGSITKPQVEPVGPLNGDETATCPVVEVEYIDSENLKDVEDLELTLQTLVTGLDSKDWVSVCDSLNNVRKLSIYHKEAMSDMLGNIIPLIVKSLKNPRSAVIKTAIMTSSDIFKAYGDDIIEKSMDPMLLQLLLKSSQDKKFVCEAAVKALVTLTICVSPHLLLPKLQPYLKNKNPRIRAKASMCYSHSVPRLGVEGIKTYGIDKLLQIAASQLSDQLPESREAARVLLFELQTVYEKSDLPKIPLVPKLTEEDNEEGKDVIELTPWEQFCQSKLSPLSAQAVLRVSNITKDG